jgi:hypothetical protein
MPFAPTIFLSFTVVEFALPPDLSASTIFRDLISKILILTFRQSWMEYDHRIRHLAELILLFHPHEFSRPVYGRTL